MAYKEKGNSGLWVLKCSCGNVFPSPIQMGPPGTQKNIVLMGNRTSCPRCGRTVIIDNSTMKWGSKKK